MKSLSAAVVTAGLCGVLFANPDAQGKASSKPSSGQQKALKTYQTTCRPCHGTGGKGLLPDTSLADGEWKHGSSLEAIAKTIAEGVPGTLMLPNKDKFSKAEIEELARLVRGFDKKLTEKKEK